MAVRLNSRGFEHAERLINERLFAIDDRDAWREHQPSGQQENEYIEQHGWHAYGRWYLGIDDQAPPDTKRHYKFPYGDFERVHRCGVLAAEFRAGQRRYSDIELVTGHLHGMLGRMTEKQT